MIALHVENVIRDIEREREKILAFMETLITAKILYWGESESTFSLMVSALQWLRVHLLR